MTPEKLGIVAAKEVIQSQEFRDKVKALAIEFMDEACREFASKLRQGTEDELGIHFDDEEDHEKHFEFAQAFEGDVLREMQRLIPIFVKEY